MKLLSKTELKDAKNRSATASREIDQSLAKKTKELNTFSASYEAQKKQILDDYIQFAEKIAGEKALLEAGFATSEERKGHALRSLSALSLGADEKLAKVERIEASFTKRENDLQVRELQLSSNCKQADEREVMITKKAEKVSADQSTLTLLREDFEKNSKVIMGEVGDRESRLNRREKILDDREKDIVTTTRSTQAIAESLKNERGSFEKEKTAEWTKLETERKRDIREIVGSEYQNREAKLTDREKSLDAEAKLLSDRTVEIEKGENRVSTGYAGLEKAVKAHQSEVKAKREEYATREAQLSRIEASQSVRDKELERIVKGIAIKSDDLSDREQKLKVNTAKEADKTLARQRELDQIASTLKTRWEKNDKAHQTRTEALDRRDSTLKDKEATVEQMEATARQVLLEAENKAAEWNRELQATEQTLEAREKTISKRESDADEKLNDARMLKDAAETESAQLTERISREDKRIAEDRRALVDARKTLDRAWTELNKKQHGR